MHRWMTALLSVFLLIQAVECYDSYGYYDDESLSGGAMAGIIIVCIVVVALKITCISCCIYRGCYRVNRPMYCGGPSTTVVAVSNSTSTVMTPPVTPYGRLQESYNPAVDGRFQPPPAYYPPPPQQQYAQPGSGYPNFKQDRY